MAPALLLGVLAAVLFASTGSAQAQTAAATPECPYWVDGHTGQSLVGFPLGTPPNTSLPANGHLAFGGHAYQKEEGSRWRDLVNGNVILGFPLGTPPQAPLYPNGNLSFAGHTYILVVCPFAQTTTPNPNAPGPSTAAAQPTPLPETATKAPPSAAAESPPPAPPRVPTAPVARSALPSAPPPAAPTSPPPGAPAASAPPAPSPTPPAHPPAAQVAANPAHTPSPPAPARKQVVMIRFDNKVAALTPLSIRALDDALKTGSGRSVEFQIVGCPPHQHFPDGSPCARRIASLTELLARRGVPNPARLLPPE